MRQDALPPSPGGFPAGRNPSPPPVGAALLLALGCLLYLGMLGSISDLGGTDAEGRAFGLLFGTVFGSALWLVLAALLAIGAARGAMPMAGRIAAAVLVPFAAAGAVVATQLIEHNSGWQILVPALLPPLIAAYALWARLPQTHRVLRPAATGAILWGAVVLVSLAPMPDFVAQSVATAKREAEYAAVIQARQAAADQQRRDRLARFRRLTDASPLWEWAAFIGKDSELDQQAVAGARKLTNRQADAEAALQRGLGFPLVEYWRLDLDVTPGLCDAANRFLRRDAAAHPAAAVDPKQADDVLLQDFSPYLEAIELLTEQNCDIDDTVAQIVRTVTAYPRSSERDALLGVLAWRRGNGFFKRQAYDKAIAAYAEAIGHDPRNEQFFDSRASAYYETGDYDRAIADYSAAIDRNKGYSSAFDSRGNAYHAKGDDDRALQDYDEALRLNPQSAAAFNNRGNLYNGRGDYARAIADFDAALRLSPESRIALNNRARARFFRGDYKAAAADFAASLKRRPSDAYAALWLYLARARSAEPARELLRADATGLDRDAWPGPLVSAYLGEADTAVVLAATRRGDASAQTARQCEASFYLGARAVSQGDAGGGRALLQRAFSLCPAGFIEHLGARVELARLPP